ncbi:MAG: hypothetical protein ABIB72_01870 [Candidatus Falkowbacteria bacterium]
MKNFDKNIIILYKDKFYSVRQVAEKLNLSSSKVKYVLEKNDIKKRKISEAIRYLNITKFNKGTFKIKENLNGQEEKLRIAGIMLYWGEGTKLGNCVTLSNSNPDMVVLYLKFLRNICGVSENRLRILLHIYPEHDEEEIKNFWSRITQIPVSQFSKTFVHKKKGGTYKKNSEHGTISLRYSDKKLLEIINGWIKESANNL